MAEVGRCERRDGAAEGVAGRHDLVGGVHGENGSYGFGDAVTGVHPGLPEASVNGTSVAEGRGDELEVEVGQPIFGRGTATEGDDDELVLGVGSNVSSNIGCKFASKVSVGKLEECSGVDLDLEGAMGNALSSRHTCYIQLRW